MRLTAIALDEQRRGTVAPSAAEPAVEGRRATSEQPGVLDAVSGALRPSVDGVAGADESGSGDEHCCAWWVGLCVENSRVANKLAKRWSE